VAIVGAISLAAQRGIVIRDAGVLERVSTCRTLIFDKTGTLTYGTPVLAEVFCAPGRSEDDVLRAAASLEQYSKHPLAYGVLQAAEKRGLILDSAERVREIPGQGLSGLVGGRQLAISGRDSAEKSLPPPEGLECALSEDGRFAALFRFRDEPRHDSHGFISHLGPRHNVRKVMLLSGDREPACRYLANATGITDVSFEKSPEEKLAIVEAETRLDRTLFVGDGVNDAPAMLAATVGVAFGRASDVACEAGGAVILETSLEKVDELIHIGRRMRTIALQSAIAGMALSVLGMVAAVLGYLPPVAGAIAQEIIDLVVVLNAVRVALPPGSLSDFEITGPVENRVTVSPD
jgi:P-type E1-E2 ATPase